MWRRLMSAATTSGMRCDRHNNNATAKTPRAPRNSEVFLALLAVKLLMPRSGRDPRDIFHQQLRTIDRIEIVVLVAVFAVHRHLLLF